MLKRNMDAIATFAQLMEEAAGIEVDSSAVC